MSEFWSGWKALIAATMGLACGLATVPYYSLSSFMVPMNAEFGWSRSEIGVAATILTIVLFITGPVMGRFADRYGARRLALPSAIMLSLAIAALTLIGDSLLQFYVGFVFLSLAGAATTSVAYTRVVTTWFERSRGLALAITMAGAGVTAFLLPLLLARVIGDFGWRGGYLACALIVLLPLPVMWRWLRERVETPAEGVREDHGMTMAEVARTRRFWTLLGAAAFLSPALQVAVIYMMPMLGEIGLVPTEAARTAALLGVGIIIGRFLSGVMLDRFSGPRVGFVLFMIPVFGYLALWSHEAALAPYAVAMVGISIGVEGDILAYFASRYFGLRSYAEVFGWIFGVMAITGACGPLLMLMIPESAGYRPVLLIFSAMAVVAAVLISTLGHYPVWRSERRGPETATAPQS